MNCCFNTGCSAYLAHSLTSILIVVSRAYCREQNSITSYFAASRSSPSASEASIFCILLSQSSLSCLAVVSVEAWDDCVGCAPAAAGKTAG